MQIRLNKFIAENTKYSRRKADELIELGKIKINNKVITELGTKIDPESAVVEIDDIPVQTGKKEKIYLMLNKPKGYLCTVKDTHNRKTILDLLPEKYKHLYPVGRLDKDSCGLILLTNDGDFAYKLTHPKFDHEKEYIVEVRGIITEDKLQSLRSPILIDDYLTRKADIEIVESTPNGTFISIILKEGRKRQIRELFRRIHKHIVKLQRIRVGNYELGELREGEYKLIITNDRI